jgi:putative flippase GtrA
MAKTAAVAQPTAFEEPSGRVPTAPDVPKSFLLVQFWRDIFGKEVQSAATYSYLWMADQMGHVALGIILQFALTFVLQYFFGLWDALASGLALLGISGVVSFWEYRAYSVAAADADKGIFPLDRTLLRDNAVIAAAYMIFGVLAGYAFHLPVWWGTVIFLIAMVLSIYYAPYWLRQKIVWQKAALPYLSRLADVKSQVEKTAATAIQDLVDSHPGTAPWRQIILAGPVGSGRTPLLTGLGTDLAFKGYKVRYIPFDSLLEINDQYRPDRPLPPIGAWGPKNIFYWPWFEAQVDTSENLAPKRIL